MKARSGTVFHKNPESLLLKENNVSRLLNDYCSTYRGVKRDFKTNLSGRSSGRAFIQKERGVILRMDGYGTNFRFL